MRSADGNPAARTAVLALILVPLCAIAGCAPGASDPRLPSSSSAPAPDTRALRDRAASEVVRAAGLLSETETCRMTGPAVETGRDRGYFLGTASSLAVQTNTYKQDVQVEPVARQMFDDDLPPMTVVIPPEVRGSLVQFSATYVAEDVAVGATEDPSNYSAWDVLLSQLVTKYEYPYTCTGPSGERTATALIGVWDGLRLAAYPSRVDPPRIIKEVPLG